MHTKTSSSTINGPYTVGDKSNAFSTLVLCIMVLNGLCFKQNVITEMRMDNPRNVCRLRFVLVSDKMSKYVIVVSCMIITKILLH